MQWLERIADIDGRLVPIYLVEEGRREADSLRHWRARIERQGYQAAVEANLSLDSAEVADSEEYLSALGISGADPRGHRVFALHTDGRRILVPALLLLSGLVGRLSAVGDRLLEAASLDGVARPIVSRHSEIEVRFQRKAKLTQDAAIACVQSRFIWLTCFPSARRFWGSVYNAAAQGVLSCEPPLANIEASFAGTRTSDTVYATRVNVRRLVPLEAPLPFAVGKVSAGFDFNSYALNDAAKLHRFRASGRPHPCLRNQADIAVGSSGFSMSEQEWGEVLAQFKLVGFPSPRSVKPNIDLALEKYGRGVAWSSMGPRWRSAETIYRLWVKCGKWDLLKQHLAALRSK